MIDFSYKDLAHILNAELINPIYYKKFDNISSDSRNITENSIFFAFKGEKFDGHDYIYNVINSGVKSIVINKDRINDFKNLQITIFAVDDTIKAYGDLAKVYKNRIKIMILKNIKIEKIKVIKEELNILKTSIMRKRNLIIWNPKMMRRKMIIFVI